MTREEAAEFTRKLVARAETIVFPKTPKTINNIPVFYFEAVLSALRGPQPDPATGLMKCDYCNGGGEQKPLFHENNYEPHTCMQSYIEISESSYGKKPLICVDLWDGANACAAFEINYCPMCGRKLEVEG